MPENEAPEHIHNFFEQDNASQGHPSQAEGGNWPYLSNNPWDGAQMPNGVPSTFNSKNYTSPSLDSQQGNVVQSIHTPFGTDPTLSTLKPELIRSQPRNQQINLNGYMHGSQGLQARPFQSDFQGDGTISGGHHNLRNRSFSSFEPQHSAPMYSSGLGRNAERQETTEAPVSFNFLGGQQLTRSQHLGLEQSHSRQQGNNEMQLWQQRLMFKRLQEMQKHQQLQQLQQRGRNHNSLSQLSGIARQGTNNQLPSLLNGMPINDASNYMQSNELMGGELKLQSSTHMLHSSNMTWAQRSGSSIQGIPNGRTLSHDQGQVMGSMGFVPQQPGQSLYGTPVASTRGSLDQPSQFQGTGNDFTSTNMTTKSGINLAEKALMHSSAFNYIQGDQYAVSAQGYLHDGISLTKQGIQGKNMFENAPVQSESGGATSGSFQQLNHFSPSVQVQEVEQVGPSQGVASLDPIEEKLLFGPDDGNQVNPFGENNDRGTGGYVHGNPSQSNDYLSACPSINSGSWSALMQDAVEASSSDTGLNEEWSGLNFQKELSAGNPSAALNSNNGKQHAPWVDGSRQNASSLNSRPFALFNDAEGSPNCHATPLQTVNFSYQQGEVVPTNAFHEPFQQCSKEPDGKSFNQQKQYMEGSLQMQPQISNASNGVWPGSIHEEPASVANPAEFNPQNMQHPWDQQQKVPLHSVNNHPINKTSGLNIEELALSGANGSKTNDNDDKQQCDMNMGRDHEGSMWNYGGGRVTSSYYGSAGGLNKIEKHKNQPTSSPQAWGLSMDSTERTSSETLLNKQESTHRKELPNEGFNPGYSISRQNTERREIAVENSFLARNDSRPLVNSSPTRQDGRENLGSYKFPFYPMGNLGMSMEPVESQNSPSYSQGSHLGVIGMKNQGQEFAGHTPFAGHTANNAGNTAKEHFADLKRNARAAEEIQSKISFPNQSSLLSPRGTTSQFAQNKRSGVTSENMLELLHKVDQSRTGNTVAHFGVSARNAPSEMPRADVSDGSASHLQHNQLGLQGSSLKLAPPSQRQSLSISDHALPSHTSLQRTANEFDQKSPDSGVRERVPTWSLSPSSVQSLPPSHESPIGEKIGDKSFIPKNRSKEFMNLNSQGNLLADAANNFRANQALMHQQQQQEHQLQQQISSASGPKPNNQSTYPPSASKVDAASKPPFHTGKGHRSHMGAIDQSVEASLSSGAGRTQPIRFSPSADSSASVGSHVYPASTGHHQTTISSTHLRSSGEQNAAVETGTAAQPSGKGTMSQHGGFSKMLHNVWTSVSSQRPVSGMQPQKIISNVLQTMSPLPSSGETNTQALQKAENHGKRKGESAPPEQGEDRLVEGTSSQGMPPPERIAIDPRTGSASRGQEVAPKHHSDGTSGVSLSSLGHLNQQDLGRGKHSQDASSDTHKGYDSHPFVSSFNHNTGPYGHNLGLSGVQKQNFSLLQQMQAMKDADSDPNNRAMKRLRGADFDSESLQKDQAATDQRYVYGQNTVLREMGAASKNISFPSEVRMLSFSSRENEGKIVCTSGQDNGKEVPSQDQVTDKHHDLHKHTLPHGKSTPMAFVGGTERPQISPQMAPSWFEQYGNVKNCQIATKNNVVESLQRSAKAADQHHFFSKFSENMNQAIVPEQRFVASQVGSLPNDVSLSPQHDMSPTGNANHSFASPHHPPLEATNNDMVLVPKKRKSATEDLVPWHKEVTEGWQRLQSISVAEREWARATNRLVDKVEDDFGVIEDGFPIARSRRRLILTTQLMQQIFPSVPSTFLAGDVTASCESMTYFCAKLTLRDACSLVSCSGGDSHIDFGIGNKASGKLKISEKEKDNHLAKTAEDLIGRSKKLENDFLSLDGRASLLDLRLECQELDRSSIMHRFAKFHSRAQIEELGSSLTSETAPRRTYPQKHVTAAALRTNLPEGVICLSL